jgi:hypothetical protein
MTMHAAGRVGADSDRPQGPVAPDLHSRWEHSQAILFMQCTFSDPLCSQIDHWEHHKMSQLRYPHLMPPPLLQQQPLYCPGIPPPPPDLSNSSGDQPPNVTGLCDHLVHQLTTCFYTSDHTHSLPAAHTSLPPPTPHWAPDTQDVQAAQKKQPNKGGIYFPIPACQVGSSGQAHDTACDASAAKAGCDWQLAHMPAAFGLLF